jgi:2-iminobutanoate/2-iminopropanoate deaminase
MRNLKVAGSSLEKVSKKTLFIKNMDDFPLVNEIYGKFFERNYPAHSCVGAARLPKDANFEVEAISLF